MNLEESIERVARIVPTVDAAFGAVVSPEAEYVQFVDDEESGCRPTSCSPASLTSCARRAPCSRSTSAVGTRDSLSRANGALEMSRTGLSNVAIKAADIGADLASLADGRYIFPPSCRHRTAL